MNSKHSYGEPKNILEFDSKNKPVIIQKTIDEIFNHPDVKNRKIVTFSIIGAFRKGKSFFLDYCLRFLYANFKSINYLTNPLAKNDWMGGADEPLKGFSWRGGRKRDTTGIIAWSDVFLHTVPSTGEKLAIIVLDTQGLFDNQATPAENARIFSLGTLISSIQVFNLMQQVQEDQLQYLQFATEFAKFTAVDNQGSGEKPFQNLMFLIRDWPHPNDNMFGTEGGDQYLEELLEVTSGQKEELKSVRQFIKRSFDEISCCLLPFPGTLVAGCDPSGNITNGCLIDLHEVFKVELESIIEKVLKPENLIIKKINGKQLTGSELKGFIEHYLKLFQSDDLPPALTIYEATVEKQLMLIVEECYSHYKETLYKNKNLVTTYEQIPIFHDVAKNQALLMYKAKKKMGGKQHEEKFEKKLNELMEIAYKEWSNFTIRNIKLLKEEQEKTREALEEKTRLEKEQLEAEKEAALKLREIERLNAEKILEQEKFEAKQREAQLLLKAEQERFAREQAESEKKAAEKMAELEKMKAEKIIDEERYENEKKVAEMKLQAEKECFQREKLEIEQEAAKKAAETERINAENILQLEKMKHEQEIAALRLQAERDRVALIEAQKEAEEAARKEMKAKLKEKENGKDLPCKEGK